MNFKHDTLDAKVFIRRLPKGSAIANNFGFSALAGVSLKSLFAAFKRKISSAYTNLWY